MLRECSQCRRPFTPQDFAREESKGMEAERKALGLQGVLFRYYNCPACGCADIFVDIQPLSSEAPEAFEKRRAELEASLKELRGDRVEVVLNPRVGG
jgi:hypothetical protein